MLNRKACISSGPIGFWRETGQDSVKMSGAAEMNVGRSNVGVLPSLNETRMPLKSISLQTRMTAGN